MPYSDPSNIDWVKEKVNLINPKSILDIGAGAGKYGKIVKDIYPHCNLEAIEVWSPYVEQFDLLNSLYNVVYIEDAREHNFIHNQYDVIFLGDILEHMTEKEAIDLWNNCLSCSSYVFLSIPTVHYPQGHEHGNPYEEHVVDDWSHEKVIEAFEGITEFKNFDVTSTYLAKGNLWK